MQIIITTAPDDILKSYEANRSLLRNKLKVIYNFIMFFTVYANAFEHTGFIHFTCIFMCIVLCNVVYEDGIDLSG